MSHLVGIANGQHDDVARYSLAPAVDVSVAITSHSVASGAEAQARHHFRLGVGLASGAHSSNRA